MEVTPYFIAERYVGMKEIPGQEDNPMILAMLKLDDDWPEHDEVPWCGSFMEFVFWILRLPRTKTKLARAWEFIGQSIALEDARVGHDVVVLSRGNNPANGHVGLFSGMRYNAISLLGGNQNNEVNVTPYDTSRIVAINRVGYYRREP